MPPPQSLPLSQQGATDVSKRRSLLPQPGQTRYGLHQRDTSVTTTESTIQPTASGRLRPRSMYQTGSIQPSQSRKEEPTSNSRFIRPPNTISKPAEPQSAGLSRSRSLRKPGVPSQSVPSTASTTHTRTQSTSSVSGPHRELSNAKIPAERPRSLLIGPNGITKPNGILSDSTSTASRASARLAGMTRTASVKTRPEISSGSASSRSGLRPDDPVGAPPRRREILREETTKTTKPAFTTLQQHFTPRKSGKAPTSTFLQPALTSGANSLPPEIISLQSELLQLHLLHQTSAEVRRQWDLSARTNLRQKFEEVASLHQTMLEYERAGQAEKNLQALLEWSAGTSSVGLIECVQILSGPLHELPSIVEPGSRFQRLAHDFGTWMIRVENVWSARFRTVEDSNLETIDGLGDSWKAESAALIRKITSFARDLDQVQQPSAGSSIASIVDTCKALLRGLSDELHIMQVVEADVVLKEKDWVEGRLQAIARDADDQLGDAEREIAAWRM